MKYSLKLFKHPLKRLKNGKRRMPGKKAFKWFTTPHRIIIKETAGEYQPIKLTKFEATDNQIKVWLKRLLDFEFKTYTAKGSVKVDRDELKSLGEFGEDLRRLIKVKKDISQLGGTDNSLIAQYRPLTQAIHGRIDTIGAATHRATHSSPNLAQIPSDKQFRSLFTAPEGWTFYGADLANIEVRILAHYLYPYDEGKYAEAVLTKDMHWYHSKLAGFWPNPDDEYNEHNPQMKSARAASKTFFFGYLYGQGSAIRGVNLTTGKLISWTNSTTGEDGIVNCGTEPLSFSFTQQEYNYAQSLIEARLVNVNGLPLFPLKKDEYVQYKPSLVIRTIYGEQVKTTFLQNMQGINELIADCQNQSRTIGYVRAIDGRLLYSRSPHSALNLLLQGSAGIVAKQWEVNYHHMARSEGLIHRTHFKQQAYIHDEFDGIVLDDYAPLLAHILESGAAKVTTDLSVNLPIKADAKLGKSWWECH